MVEDPNMPRKFTPRRMKLCSVAGCKNLTIHRNCELHSGYSGLTAKQAESKQFLNSTAWLKLRAAKLQQTPHCEYCAQAGRGEFIPAIDVDHVLPRHSHPQLRLEITNLKSSCKRCHGQKTARGE